jgi:hypothetical protein
LTAVAFGGGQFVAAGAYGTVVTSPDGINWTFQNRDPFSTSLSGVAFANGMYAAVGPGGAILTSTDGAIWTAQQSGTSNDLHAVIGNSFVPDNGLPEFVAVGDGGTMLSTGDGTNWTFENSGTSNSLNAVAIFSQGFLSFSTIVAVGNAGTILQDNGGTWETIRVPTTEDLFAVACGNGIFAAGGGIEIPPVLLFSQDEGSSWQTAPASNFWATFTTQAMAFGGNQFVAFGNPYTIESFYADVALTSVSGTNWIGLANNPENWMFGATYGNGVFVAVGDAGSINVSSNGQSWMDVTGPHRSGITAIGCSPNLCVASGFPRINGDSDFTTIISTNGVDWFIPTTNAPNMAGLATSGNVFAGVTGGCVFTTVDGLYWSPPICISTNSLNAICFANGQFVAVGDSGSIYTSSDGLNWSNRSIATTATFNSVTFGNGLFIAAGTETACSTNGLSWTVWPTNPPEAIAMMTYGNGAFIAAGRTNTPTGGDILYSSDGLNWQVTYPLYATGLAYANDTFLADHGGALASP